MGVHECTSSSLSGDTSESDRYVTCLQSVGLVIMTSHFAIRGRFDVDELPQLQDSTSSCLSLVFFPVVLALSLSVHAAYLFALFWHFGAAAIADWPATADTKTATASAPEAVA